MSALSSLISDVDHVIARGSGRSRGQTLSRITDLLLQEDGGLRGEQIDVFDSVIGRFTPAVETPARVTLAERIAGLRNGPPGVIRSLAFDDEIAVARPVLARSPQLDDQDLMAVASEKGPRHMLAICERPRIAETVTDVLVSLGNGDVKHAVAVNAGAKLSEQGTATLIAHALDDEKLQVSLGERRDLSTEAARRLVEVARESTRRLLLASLPPEDAAAEPAEPTAPPEGGRDYASAASAIRAILQVRRLGEADLSGFASERREPESILALAALTGLPPSVAERIYDDRGSDALLLLCRSQDWSWPTARSLLRLRDPALAGASQFGGVETSFRVMTPAKARRTFEVLQQRGAFGAPPASRRVPVRSAGT